MLRTVASVRTGVRPERALSSAAAMYGPIPDICDPPDAMTSIIVCVPNVLPPKPVVVQWKSVPCDPCVAGFVTGVVVGVDGVLVVVEPEVVLPRRVPVPDMPKNVEPLDVDVDVVGLVIAAVVGAEAVVVGATGAGATPSSCWRICISGDSEPPDVVVVGVPDVVVVVVVDPHSVPDVDGVGVVEPSRELPYTPLDVRSDKLDVVVGGGVTTVVVVPHPGSLPDPAGSLPLAPGTTPT